MILFSLSYLPDEVVQKVDFTQEQWSLKLQEEMLKYKEKWSQKRQGRKWEWQTDEVERALKQHFENMKQEKDTEYLKDKQVEQDLFEQAKKTAFETMKKSKQ